MDTSRASGARWRRIVFPLLAALFAVWGLVAVEGLTEGLMPWVILGCPGCSPQTHPEVQRWHGAMHGALLGILLSGSLIALLWRASTKPLLLQFYVLGHLLLLAGFHAFAFQPWFPVNPFFIGTFLLVDALLVATFPAPRALLDFGLPEGRSRRLMAVTGLCALALAPVVVSRLRLQLLGTAADEHAVDMRWAEEAIVCAALLAAGWLSSTKRGGWRELGVLTGLAYLFLGAAALTVPAQTGSWGVGGGLAALLGGVAYLGATFVESRAAAVQPLQGSPG